nr:hypothetical protein RVX_1598 [Nitratidesulfovibrio sp. HK-II]
MRPVAERTDKNHAPPTRTIHGRPRSATPPPRTARTTTLATEKAPGDLAAPGALNRWRRRAAPIGNWQALLRSRYHDRCVPDVARAGAGAIRAVPRLKMR